MKTGLHTIHILNYLVLYYIVRTIIDNIQSSYFYKLHLVQNDIRSNFLVLKFKIHTSELVLISVGHFHILAELLQIMGDLEQDLYLWFSWDYLEVVDPVKSNGENLG